MKLESIKTFLSDRRAVSPVLGVALLIAITVILAGVIGFVVLGVQAGNADGPSSSLVFDGTELHHKGGDALTTDHLVVKVNGATQAEAWADSTDATAGDDSFTTGESETLDATLASGDTVRIVWQDPNSDREVLVAEFNVE